MCRSRLSGNDRKRELDSLPHRIIKMWNQWMENNSNRLHCSWIEDILLYWSKFVGWIGLWYKSAEGLHYFCSSNGWIYQKYRLICSWMEDILLYWSKFVGWIGLGYKSAKGLHYFCSRNGRVYQKYRLIFDTGRAGWMEVTEVKVRVPVGNVSI